MNKISDSIPKAIVEVPYGKISKNKAAKRVLEIFMLILSLIWILPFLFAVLNSFKNSAEAAKLDFAIPSQWVFKNYYTVFTEGRIFNGLLNSLLITCTSVAIIIFISSLASFVLGRKKTKYIKIIYLFFVVGLIPPPFVITTIKTLQLFHLSGSYIGIILFYSAIYIPFSVFLITGFIKMISRELDEAAIMEGCGPFRLFFQILFPLLKPVIATTVVFCFMFIWNDLAWPIYLLNDSKKWTIPLSVFNFISKYGSRWQLVFADLIIAAVPVLALYFSAQNLVISGLTAGAIKG